MDIGTILALKEEVDDLSKRQEDIYCKIKEYCQSLEPDDINSLSYADAKEVYTSLKVYLPESVKKVYEAKRLEEYPELKKAVNYPELNEIDFLPLDKIKKIDSLLSKYKKNEIIVRYNKRMKYYYMSSFRSLKIDMDMQKKLVDFLCDKGILIHAYAFYCHCGCCSKVVTETEYEKLKNICEKEVDNFEDIFVVPCYLQPDGDYEIFDKESFENANYLDIYLKGKDPDKSHLTW